MLSKHYLSVFACFPREEKKKPTTLDIAFKYMDPISYQGYHKPISSTHEFAILTFPFSHTP